VARTPARIAGVKRLVAVTVVVAAGLYALWRMSTPLPPVDVTASVEQSADAKVQAFAVARARAEATGHPIRVSETFTDAELTWLANRAAEDRDAPVQDVVLHVDGGTVEAQAEAIAHGQTLPVRVAGTPRVNGDRVSFQITSLRIGPLPVPPILLDRFGSSMRQALEVGSSLSGFTQVQIQTANGSSTVSAVAEPASDIR
jgi:hypothetical protein